MHLPDGALSLPMTVATCLIGCGGLAFCVHQLRRRMGDRTTVLLGASSAFIFAGQMVNFPLFPLPISGHLMGGTLAAVLLGPWAGACAIALVLLVQTLLFGDGGVSALGANFINMGLIGALAGSAIYQPLRRVIPGRGGYVLASMLASWFTVILSAAAAALELGAGLTVTAGLNLVATMLLVHSAIGLGEALITGSVLVALGKTRPDFITADDPETKVGRLGQSALGFLLVAMAVSILLAPWASSFDDGLEYVVGRLGVFSTDAPSLTSAPMPDYQFPGLPEGASVATAAAGAIGTLVVFLVGVSLSFGVSRFAADPSRQGPRPDAV